MHRYGAGLLPAERSTKPCALPEAQQLCVLPEAGLEPTSAEFTTVKAYTTVMRQDMTLQQVVSATRLPLSPLQRPPLHSRTAIMMPSMHNKPQL